MADLTVLVKKPGSEAPVAHQAVHGRQEQHHVAELQPQQHGVEIDELRTAVVFFIKINIE